VIGSPRSANTSTRQILKDLFGLEDSSAFTPDEVEWNALPERIALQIHWAPTRSFTALLNQHRFQVCVLIRHPLDTLISILQLAGRIEATSRWLDGQAGGEQSIAGANPSSEEFLRYSTSSRAQLLLRISPRWWTGRAAMRLRFEDLMADPAGHLGSAVGCFGLDPVAPVADVLADRSFANLQREVPAHYWQGEVGLWRQLLTADRIARLAPVYARQAARFGYDLTPDPQLTLEQAQSEWHRRVL
jgi:hypothetical protein